MKTTYKVSLFLIALCVTCVTFWACKRTVKNDEILGNTELKAASADFTGIINSPTPITRVWTNRLPRRSYHTKRTDDPSIAPFQIRFAVDDKIYFETEFSHEITWFVEFDGVSSGAKKIFSATSKTLDTSLVFWDGAADGFRFFNGEAVNYTISFLGTSLKYSGTLNINPDADLGPKGYTSTTKAPYGSNLKYARIDNMEAAGGIKTSYSDAADGTGAARFFVTDAKAVDGHFSYYMKGTDNNGNGYCGGSSGEALTELQNITTITDPTKIYFNAYVYGYGRPNSAVFFQAFENDFATPPTFPLPRVTSQNDMWYTIIQVDWIGWKLVSVPYSSFKPANNPASGGGGNRIQEPHKLCGFGIELDAYPTTGVTVELAIDEITLTENGPFQP